MNEEMLREMIRESVARHMGLASAPERHAPQPLPFQAHASHFRYRLPESGGPCLIEPVVSCTHCGYCQSHGH
ncbi:MAG: hypothetical protein A3H96_18365 [Acidobacteria bacterium RIFCSPLOWO2_02_FULL_67_36]|nr:MAG: hypothetical protein A3H96_18365 [Acidobacteria bacterium RIFCSPLOWO2_02_FULL_67_36]OFW19052.1 MAG: hypothetical protein A3G21_04980 [Acidobacteria bacterium RIFCSPLOWO2_12_FULL_66_21]